MPLNNSTAIPFIFYFLLLTGVTAQADVLPNTQRKLNTAIAFHENKQTSEAINSLNAYVVNRATDQAEIYRLLGFLHWEQNKPILAINALEQAVSLNQNAQGNIRTRRMLADIYSTQRQHKQALNHYEWLVNAGEDKKPEIWLMMANSAYHLSEWKKVIHAANRCSLLENRSHEPSHQQQVVLLQKAVAQQKINQWYKSIQTLDNLTQAFPDLKKGWQLKLYALQHLKRDRELLDTWRLALTQGIQFSSAEIKLLAHYFYLIGIPYNAAELIQSINKTAKKTEFFQLEAKYWQAAKQWKKSNQALDKLKLRNVEKCFLKVRNYYALGEWHYAMNTLKELRASCQLNEKENTHAKQWETLLLTHLQNR